MFYYIISVTDRVSVGGAALAKLFLHSFSHDTLYGREINYNYGK